jgi:copper oxidase (laccase) domain-containing protein
MLAAVGPGIGRCCYTVGDEVRGRFGAEFGYAEELFTRDGDAMRLDLIEANRRQLQAAAVAAGSIQVVGGCTACMPGWFYSHRASGGNTGRMMAVVGIRG